MQPKRLTMAVWHIWMEFMTATDLFKMFYKPKISFNNFSNINDKIYSMVNQIFTCIIKSAMDRTHFCRR